MDDAVQREPHLTVFGDGTHGIRMAQFDLAHDYRVISAHIFWRVIKDIVMQCQWLRNSDDAEYSGDQMHKTDAQGLREAWSLP
jgi:hypothetical protein